MYGLLHDGDTLTILYSLALPSRKFRNDLTESLLTLKSALKKTSLSDTQMSTICSAWDSHMKKDPQWLLGLVHSPTQMYLVISDPYYKTPKSLLTMASSIWQGSMQFLDHLNYGSTQCAQATVLMSDLEITGSKYLQWKSSEHLSTT